MRATVRTTLLAGVLALVLGALGACAPLEAGPDGANRSVAPSLNGSSGAAGATGPGADGGPTPVATRALEQLELLQVRGRAPLTGYDRDLFGQAWADTDRNGCDTRNDILRRDLQGEEIKPGTFGCLVLTGTLVDPYSGETISFVRGQETSTAVQVDHVVSLADAWQSGAHAWGLELRTKFANDPLNLLAVDGGLNQQKGASNAASWLPPDRDAWCGFASQQIAVKLAYALSVTPSERNALHRAAMRCEEDGLLVRGGPVPLGDP